jgi:hypothetical protein
MAPVALQRGAGRCLHFAANGRHIRGVRPDHGGRLELKLREASQTTARYTLTVFMPDHELTTEVHIDAPRDALELGEWQGGAPAEWLESYARALLRTVLRSKNSDGDWPRRVTRWRPAPKP